MEKPNLVIDGWQVSPHTGTLARDSAVVHLEPRVMDVLVYLAARPGQVVTREELERTVWRGALVGYDAVTSTIIKLRKALGDDARQPRLIVTVPKKGYQLVVPVHHADVVPATMPALNPARTEEARPSSGAGKPGRSRLALFGVAVVMMAAVLIVWRGFSLLSGPAAELPSVLVLPFENVGVGEGHEVFVDGITEDIITDLSRLAGLSVMSSSVTFKYKGSAMAPPALHEELKIDYVVQGSVRRRGRNVRVNVQLVNARTGYNLWAQGYDRKLEEVFSVQDDITHRIIDALSISPTSVEKERLAQRTTRNLRAYDSFLEGLRQSKEGTREANRLAADAYRNAIELDPTYGRAYGALAFILATDFRRGWTDSPVESLDRALALAEKGVELNGTIPHTHWSLGYVHLMRKEFKRAVRAALRSTEISRNYADGYGLLALIYNNLGDPQKALDNVEKGMKINPYYTWDYLFNLGWAHYMLGEHNKAIGALEAAQQRNESAIPIKLILAASYARAGRLDDADWTVQQLQLLNPMTTLSHTTSAMPLANSEFLRQLLADLRKAGLPE